MYWNTNDGFRLPDVEVNEITDKYTDLMRLGLPIKTLYSDDGDISIPAPSEPEGPVSFPNDGPPYPGHC